MGNSILPTKPPKALTAADKEALRELPASGWFEVAHLPINRPSYRCERLEEAGFLETRVVGQWPSLKREYRRIDPQTSQNGASVSNTPTTDGRKSLRISSAHPLLDDLRSLAEKHGLAGCVLIAFDVENDRVSTSVPGTNQAFVDQGMKPLADQLLARIDNGEFDPK
ncbi:hypothetical protein PZT57_26930 [Pseudomonas aeruginosa]|uniref:hypothetical protein n=1 Tax=Pseudomonas aeruginosa TaxID=287 RepID=UPI002B26E5AC|nr:hypothetical protein [Pseudomonas aeruginosa]MEA8592286.1 hypothetical protein [Pseudomonas aeruginosa]